MSNMYISYRREDSTASERIHDRLVAHFGKINIFMDAAWEVPSPDVSFQQSITSVVEKCAVMLVIIGPHWHYTSDDYGRRRLDNPDDSVRVEIEAALTRNIPVIPVLITGATMPYKDALPPSLQEITNWNATHVRNNPDFERDMQRLIDWLERLIGGPIAAPHVFVSHSHADNAYCREFVNTLRAVGCDVWYDEDNLGWGALRQVIERELNVREHFIAILSPAAVASDWVQAEIDAAVSLLHKGPLHTFQLVTAAPCEVPLLLQRYKRIEESNGQGYVPDQAATRAVSVIEPKLLSK